LLRQLCVGLQSLVDPPDGRAHVLPRLQLERTSPLFCGFELLGEPQRDDCE
jgi:hypothetical protein